MSKKTALIFGVTGQDGSYLTELLLEKNYEVYGAIRRVANRRLLVKQSYNVVDADVTDAANVSRVIKSIKPDEIYNLAGQSHVAISFEEPAHTFDVNTRGCLNILEAIRSEHPSARLFQANSSEMWGGTYSQRVALVKDGGIEVQVEKFQDETTPFYPRSPYAISKLAAHNLVQTYRTAYKLYACSGIMFNHESPRRGENFVTRKITKYVASLKHNKPISIDGRKFIPPSNIKLKLGNLDVWRDWGHAKDFVRAMHLMLNQDIADDYVIATCKVHSLTNLLEIAFNRCGLKWQDWVETDENLRRPNEVVYCKGDASKIKNKLSWEPQITFKELITEMVDNEG